jgi:hypothetical protein
MNIYRLSLFLTPVSFRWTIPLKMVCHCFREVQRLHEAGHGTGRYSSEWLIFFLFFIFYFILKSFKINLSQKFQREANSRFTDVDLKVDKTGKNRYLVAVSGNSIWYQYLVPLLPEFLYTVFVCRGYLCWHFNAFTCRLKFRGRKIRKQF